MPQPPLHLLPPAHHGAILPPLLDAIGSHVADMSTTAATHGRPTANAPGLPHTPGGGGGAVMRATAGAFDGSAARPISNLQDPTSMSLSNVAADPAYTDWRTGGLFDGAIDDRGNLRLGENTVAVLSAVLTGFAMVLVTDLIFRLVVRARRAHISTHHVYRAELLARFANPLEWPAALAAQARRAFLPGGTAKRDRPEQLVDYGPADAPAADWPAPPRVYPAPHADLVAARPPAPMQPASMMAPGPEAQQPVERDDMGEQPRGPTPSLHARAKLPAWQHVLIIAAGLFITAAQLLLIFLATNQNTGYPLDLRAIPAFALSDPGANASLLVPVDALCSARPLLSLPGYSTSATVFLCAPSTPHPENSVIDRLVRAGAPRDSVAVVAFASFGAQVKIYVFTDGMYVIYDQELAIGVENGTQYISEARVRARDARAVVPSALARFGVDVTAERSDANVSGVPTPNWVDIFTVRGPAAVPASFARMVGQGFDSSGLHAANYSQASATRNFFLGAAARSMLSLSARARAYHGSPTNGPFLDQVTEPLVTSQRPWLSVVACAAVCGTFLAVWLAVVLVLRWRPTVDAKLAWTTVFAGVRTNKDFARMPPQIVERERQ